MSDHTKMKKPSLWLPEADTTTLLALGKLAEEANELAARATRCIIQGLNAVDPGDGRQNYEHLMEEIADVRGLSDLVIRRETMDEVFIQNRADAKRAHKEQWMDMVEEHLRGTVIPLPTSAPALEETDVTKIDPAGEVTTRQLRAILGLEADEELCAIGQQEVGTHDGAWRRTGPGRWKFIKNVEQIDG